MINLLNPSVKVFTHIIQIADIHIRLNKRHDEYREVFSKLYEEIDKSPESTVVTIVGDVFHNKSDLSPECIQLASDLFKNIADRRPLVLVAGNHDATLSNKNRLDSLTPLIDALNHSNVFYLKTTGLYGFGNILWNNMCVFDPVEKYIYGKDIPEIYRNQYSHIIALFHGPIDGANTDTGYKITNPAVMSPLFDHNDIALCGDIHLIQNVQDANPEYNKPCVRYCGSLIQQNHGEVLHGHGYTLWDLSTKTYTHHEIQNDYGYFTIEINKGVLVSKIEDIPKKVRLRVKCYETISSEVKAILSTIKSRCHIIETAYVRMDAEKDRKDIIPLCKNIVLTDLTNVDYQNKLISEFILSKTEIKDQSKIDRILSINRATNLLIKKDDFSRSLKWKPIRFEFDNMFKYGEGNYIDFSNMEGVYGIFGTNRSGKSSILSAILFCLFDKFDRGFKGAFVLNSQKTTFRCKLEFEISGVRYFIERTGNTTRTGNVKVDVEFWKIENGVKEELHGTERRNTNDIIRDYVGTYEDFVLTATSFVSAKDSKPFIDMGNTERKDLLVQFMGLNVFDRLHESASERNKEINGILKSHKDKNYQFEVQENTNAYQHASSLFDIASTEVAALQKSIDEVNEQIVLETSNLIKLDSDVPTDFQALVSKKQTAESQLQLKSASMLNLKKELAEKEQKIESIEVDIKQIESSNLVESHKKYKSINDSITNLKQKMDLKKVEVRGKLEKVARLEKHEYDPNCKYCTNNSFVKDATQAKTELAADKNETDKMLAELDILLAESETFKWVEQAYEKYTKFLNDRSKIKDECAIISRNIILSTNEIEKLDGALKTIVNQMEIYHRNKVSVESNAIIYQKIASHKNSLTKLNIDIQHKNRTLIDLSGKKELFKSKIESLTKTINEVKEYETESEIYTAYLLAVGRDGIPYQVICNTVPEIEREVNSTLCQVVDYTIQFETDGKNIVPYIVYDYGRWPIEMTSGYERFVASIAIRIALTNISNLPKTTFLAIDEGFGTLDSDHMSSMYTLFSFLKTNFDFILVISHIDALKDAVDKQIELTQEGNFTKVIFD